MNHKEIEEYRTFTGPQELHKAIYTLRGIVAGIRADSQINTDEINELIYWCTSHEHLEDKHPFTELIPVIEDACEDGVITKEELQDILWVCDNLCSVDNPYYDQITSSIQYLCGIIHGMLADNTLADDEILALHAWIKDNDYLTGTYPFDEIESLLSSILMDGVITEEERNMLMAFFSNFIDISTSRTINYDELLALKEKYSIEGICSICQDIDFDGSTFCFTGKSKVAKRNDIAKIITDHGGKFSSNVSKKTRYLIVGVDGNPCWAYSCHGRKIEEAMTLRKSGQNLTILSEVDFWDILEDS